MSEEKMTAEQAWAEVDRWADLHNKTRDTDPNRKAMLAEYGKALASAIVIGPRPVKVPS